MVIGRHLAHSNSKFPHEGIDIILNNYRKESEFD